jgi:hypothetical protein
MDEAPPTETIELDHDRFITLDFSRRWPQYVVEWSVRQRSSDFDFPLASNTLQRPPIPVGGDVEVLWGELRQEALTQARQALEGIAAPEREVKQRRSLFGRLFGRG